MRKRAGVGYVLSMLLPLVALAIVMLRSFDQASRVVGLGLWLAGWVALIFAIRRHRRATVHVEHGRRWITGLVTRYGKPLVSGAALVGSAVVALTLIPVDERVFLGVDPRVVERWVDEDLVRVQRYRTGLQGLAGPVTALSDVSETPTAADKSVVLDTWAAYLDYTIALDRLVETHKYFYQIDPIRYRDANARSFLVGYGALVTQLEAAVALVDAVGTNRSLETILDGRRPELGVPAGSYFALKQQLTRPANLLRLSAGRLHLATVRLTGLLHRPDVDTLATELEGSVNTLWKRLGEEGGVFVDNPLDVLESRAYMVWFPLQKRVAETMGDLRTTARENFVTVEQLEAVREKLAPGDILLERRNWYVSNVGLPGFWPHAALYTGTLKELDAHFGEADRGPTGGVAPSDYIRETYPEVARSYDEPDEEGHPKRIIEAISEGVVLTSLEHSGAADYLGVVRPRFTKAGRLAALLRAFDFHGRPYDFDFDFMTDEALVCSELVYKAYQPLLERTGRGFGLARTSGRFVLPPNNIARRFDEEHGTEDAVLEFVLFLDGSEEERRANLVDAETFRATWRRPKWDIAQK